MCRTPLAGTLLCALHMLFIVWYPPERSAPHLLQDLCDLCAGIAILPQCGADAGIALALAAHQHGHVGHRHIPGGVTAQTGGSARAAAGCTGGRTARASAASLTACRRAASAACFLRALDFFRFHSPSAMFSFWLVTSLLNFCWLSLS